MSRSENMRRIRGRNTKPEIVVRKLLRKLGYVGYRLHRKDLPGKPDIVFVGKKKVILVHGCFWHGHYCKIGSRKPGTNQSYWLPKIEKTRQRDLTNTQQLTDLGWQTLTLWECQLGDLPHVENILLQFMNNQ